MLIRLKMPRGWRLPRNIDPDLLFRMGEAATSLCVLCRIRDRSGGTIVALTTHAEDITAYIGGTNVLFKSRPGLFGSKTAADMSMQIDNSEVGAYIVSNVISTNQLYGSRVEGARYELYICDYEFPGSSHAPYLYDQGFIGEIPISDTAFKVGLRSLVQPLHQPIGTILQPGCRALRVGEPLTCNFPMSGTRRNPSNHAFRLELAQVSFVIDQVTFQATSGDLSFSSQPDVWFAEGVLRWIASVNDNDGLEFEVRTYDISGSTMTFILQDAPGGAIIAGDTFTVDAGCNHTPSHCFHKFRTVSPAGFVDGNMHNFQGEPHLTDESELVQMVDRWVTVTFLAPPLPIETL